MKGTEDISLGYKPERFSLIYILHAISHLSRDEIELLKTLRQDISMLDRFKEDRNEVSPQIGNILEKFSLGSIQEVIDIVENYNLLDLV